MTTTNSTSRRSSSSRRDLAIVCSTRRDGDFHPARQTRDEIERRRRGLIDLPWTMTDQRHGVGVVDVALRAFSEPVVEAVLGPTIGACCYEFGDDELAAVARGAHAAPDAIRGRTSSGATALDATAGVRSAVGVYDVDVALLGGCTGCTYDGFSHRVRRDRRRHVVAAWRPRT